MDLVFKLGENYSNMLKLQVSRIRNRYVVIYCTNPTGIVTHDLEEKTTWSSFRANFGNRDHDIEDEIIQTAV